MNRWIALSAAVSLSLACESAAAADGVYARPRLLIEPADLQKDVAAAKVTVLDARKREEFEKGHVPSALWVDAAAWAKDFGKGDDAKAWSDRIGALGIGPDRRVVVHDDGWFKDAARVWWILRYWGVRDAALLNGNWQGWKAAGLPVEQGAPKAVTAAKFPAVPGEKHLATKKTVLDTLGTGKVQIIDARSEAEHCGTDPQKNRRGGAIPGAALLEWIDLVDKGTQRFKSADELTRLFKAAGIDPGKPSIAHCQSGGRASVTVFGLELLGAEDVRNYYASWAEWGNADDTPVVPGKPKAAK